MIGWKHDVCGFGFIGDGKEKKIKRARERIERDGSGFESRMRNTHDISDTHTARKERAYICVVTWTIPPIDLD